MAVGLGVGNRGGEGRREIAVDLGDPGGGAQMCEWGGREMGIGELGGRGVGRE